MNKNYYTFIYKDKPFENHFFYRATSGFAPRGNKKN